MVLVLLLLLLLVRLFVCLFFKIGFSVQPGCPGTCSVDQADYELREICLPLLPSAEIKGVRCHYNLTSIITLKETKYKHSKTLA